MKVIVGPNVFNALTIVGLEHANDLGSASLVAEMTLSVALSMQNVANVFLGEGELKLANVKNRDVDPNVTRALKNTVEIPANVLVIVA